VEGCFAWQGEGAAAGAEVGPALGLVAGDCVLNKVYCFGLLHGGLALKSRAFFLLSGRFGSGCGFVGWLGGCGLFVFGGADFHLAVAEGFAVEGLDGVVGAGFGFHVDEAEAFAFPGEFVADDGEQFDVAIRGK